MSTRTTIKIKDQGEIIASLYRHCDRYPAETGADLIQTAQQCKYAEKLAKTLLEKRYPIRNHQTAPEPIYQIAGTAGDIEHYYEIDFDPDDKIIIRYADRQNFNQDVDAMIATARSLTVQKFVEIINRERQEINNRLANLKKESPELYRECDPYPMLEIKETV